MTDVGSIYRITYEVRDATGTLVAPGTITLTLFDPNGASVVSPATVNDSVGKYHWDYVTPVPGRFTGVIATTAPVSQRGFSFNIDPVPSNTIISLKDGKVYLNLDLARTTDDEEVLDFIKAITEIIENKVGDVCLKTIVNEYVESGPNLWLQHTPVVSVVSIVPYLTTGIGYATNLIRADAESGRVRHLYGEYFLGGPFAVTYKAGRTIIPSNLTHGAKIMLGHLWLTQRGGMSFGSGSPGPETEDEIFNISGREYTIPRRVMETLQPHKLGPRVA